MPRRTGRYRKPRKFIKRYAPRSLYRIGRTVQYLKKVINVEFKTTPDVGTITPSTSGDIRLFFGVAQGDGKGQRDGMSIKCQYCSMKGFITKHTTPDVTTVRMILILDTQPNGALPALGDVLDGAGSGDPTLRPMNVDNGSRFKILKQKIITVDNNTPRKQFRWYRKLPFHIKYSGATSGIGSIRTNSLILLTVSTEPTNAPTITYNMQGRYTDN